MVSVETISIVFTGLSVSLAAFYYVSTLRNAQKTQRLALESRQTQIFMQVYQQLNSEESFRTFAELMNLECENYDEFLRKYDSSVNPNNFGKRSHIWWSYNTIGVLLHEGLIEPDLVFKLLGPLVVQQWKKWSSIIEEIRERENVPENLKMFEYLYGEMRKLREQMNYPEITYPATK
jgi:hypothetical protein